VEGDEQQGYRVRAAYSDWNGVKLTTDYFIVREDEGLRLLDSTDAYSFTLAGLACEAGRRLDRSDLEGARRLLDWAAQIDSSSLTNFRTLWCSYCDRSMADARVAVAILQSRVETRASGALPLLRQAYREETASDRRLALNRALALASQLSGQVEEALKLHHEALREHPDFTPGVTEAVTTLGKLGRWAEARSLLQDRLKQNPADDSLIRSLLFVEVNSGEWEAAEQAVERLENMGKATASDRNTLAWGALVTGAALEKARAVSDRASADTRHGAPPILNTQAAVYAASGNADQARKILVDSMRFSNAVEPREHDWFVQGLIAEQYGLLDEAREAYRRAVGERGPLEPFQVGARAQRRLEALQ
jgi:tetratricopeptide (TPR) repeat protein